MYDAIVIGGGFYGSEVARYLRTRRGFVDIMLIEREDELLSRASYRNQARVHNGYHYPRSFKTAFRSRINHPRFSRDYPQTVNSAFTNLYAIASQNSKVTSRQFEHFCREIGATLAVAPASLCRLFDPRLIESVYLVDESVFDAEKLRAWVSGELAACGVKVRVRTRVDSVRAEQARLSVRVAGPHGECEVLDARYVFNCAYSGLNQHCEPGFETSTALKHEITEMGLLELPDTLKHFGVTVMDGPFFSIMPFPSRGLHTLSHVRYTPHVEWSDRVDDDPYTRLAQYPKESRVDRMMRDVMRYMPEIVHAAHVESLFEIKTVLSRNEVDDGRPILFERHARLPNYYAILGGKIDNIYDIFDKLDAEPLGPV